MIIPVFEISTKLTTSLHSSNAIGLGTLTFAKQYQKSVPTVISDGHVNTGPSRSLSLMICVCSTNSSVHQSSTVHVRKIFVPPPQSCNTLSQYPRKRLHKPASSVR